MEILYSKTILAFLKKVRALSLTILSEEMEFTVGRTRFYKDNVSYPLQFAIFDHPSRLGYFESPLFEIGINKLFLLEKDGEIKNLLRHELAHYITFIEHGEGVRSHGKEFREICKRYGWPTEVSKAQIPIEKAIKNKRIVEKVRKLLSLGNSPHSEEAKSAILKAQELLGKYNLELSKSDEETVVLRVLEKKRGGAKLQAIAAILRTFFVYPIFNHGKGTLYLEIVGDRVNTQIAEYVAHFLDHQFEILWQEGKKKDPLLKGTASKNSFFRGLAEGYQKKEELSSLKGLIRLEKNLIKRVEAIYPNLSATRVSYQSHERAKNHGKVFGKNLKIREGIKKNLILLLS